MRIIIFIIVKTCNAKNKNTLQHTFCMQQNIFVMIVWMGELLKARIDWYNKYKYKNEKINA